MNKILKEYVLEISVGVIYSIYLILQIFASTSSTAPIGFLFLPIFFVKALFITHFLKQLYYVVFKKHSFLTKKNILLFIFTLGVLINFVLKEVRRHKIESAKNPKTDIKILREWIYKNTSDKELLYSVAQNPNLMKKDFDFLFKYNLKDYYLMSVLVKQNYLDQNQIKEIINLNENDFKTFTEYSLYQNYVWSCVIKSKSFNEGHYQALRSKTNPEHFFIISMIDSEFSDCSSISSFLPQENQVLQNMILNKLKLKGCP